MQLIIVASSNIKWGKYLHLGTLTCMFQCRAWHQALITTHMATTGNFCKLRDGNCRHCTGNLRQSTSASTPLQWSPLLPVECSHSTCCRLKTGGNRSSVQSQCTSALQEKWFQQFLEKKHRSANPKHDAELTMQLQKEHNYFRIEVAKVNALRGFHQTEVQRSMKIQTHTHTTFLQLASRYCTSQV